MIGSYHWRAYRYRELLWGTHLRGVERFLNSWSPPAHLLLVGPSAGYSLPLPWFSRFQSVTLIEPSAWARKMLAAKLRPIVAEVRQVAKRVDFESSEFLTEWAAPDTGVLFANVLGQVKVRDAQTFAQALHLSLAHLPWASFHDRFSSAQLLWDTPTSPQTRVLPTETLLREPKRPLGDSSPIVQEHLASEALQALRPTQVQYWDWQIAPGQVHLIEGLMGAGSVRATVNS